MDLQKRWMNFLIIAEAVVLVFLLGFGMLVYGSRSADDSQNKENQDKASSMEEQNTTKEASDNSKPEFSDEVISLMENMTMEEKVAQLFIITPEALTGVGRVTVARTVSQDAIKTYPVGGLIFAMTNYADNSQFQSLIHGYHGFSQSVLGVRLFIVGSGLSENVERLGVNMKVSDIPIADSFDVAVVEAIRAEHGPETLVLSGDLSSESIAGSYENGQAEVAAVKAGVDLLYHPKDFKAAYGAVLKAVQTEEIPTEVLENAVGRILTAKLK